MTTTPNGKKPPAPALLPFDEDAERATLGAILLDAEIALPAVAATVEPRDFFIDRYRWTYAAMLALRDRGVSIDHMTLTAELETRGQLAEVGGPGVVAGLDNAALTARHAESYALIVKEKAARRLWLNWASEVASEAYGDGFDPDVLIATTRLTLEALRRDRQSASDRFALHFAREALEPQPPVDWIIDRLFAAGSVAALVGEGGSKKTWTALDAAVAVATGARWLDFQTTRGMVLIVDEESGRHRLNRRLADVLRGHEVAGDPPIVYVSLAGFNLWQSPDDALALHDLVRSVSARFVVLDALADVLLGGDENSATDVQVVFHALRVVAEAEQCAILVIHHSNKVGVYRGSTAIKAAVDLLVNVESRADDTRIDFTIEKSRDGEPFTFAALANFGSGTFNLSPAATSEKAEHFSKSENYVLRYLREHGTATITDIANRADVCSGPTARRAVYRLADRGKVRRINSGGKGTDATYALAEDVQL